MQGVFISEKALKSQNFPQPPNTLDLTEVIDHTAKIERRSKLRVATYFPPND